MKNFEDTKSQIYQAVEWLCNYFQTVDLTKLDDEWRFLGKSLILGGLYGVLLEVKLIGGVIALLIGIALLLESSRRN